ncbi:hypothetical protein H8E88_19500 [candidate division KSB1 bacterium]|nr:hypothetical protein [candidate division KSB1 bacterium]MBL7093151.1 hypothetical protein [candidate division KSB1 bacterium]
MNQHEYFAVLTGDIIKSSLLSKSDLGAVRSSLLNAVDVVKGWKRGLVLGKTEFFRGDAWQLLLKNPALAMRVGVFLRASLITEGKADSRISVGLGKAQNISLNRVSLSTGEAFFLSGHGLDSMTQYSNMTIVVPKSTQALSEWLPVVGHLCDSLISQWTQRQAEIVCLAVEPKEPTHEEIAQRLNPTVSKQTVTKVLNSANWYVIREAIHQFEKTVWESVIQHKKG